MQLTTLELKELHKHVIELLLLLFIHHFLQGEGQLLTRHGVLDVLYDLVQLRLVLFILDCFLLLALKLSFSFTFLYVSALESSFLFQHVLLFGFALS